MAASRHNLLGLSLHQLSEFAERLGEKRYRGKQLFEWLYAKGAESFADMTTLSKATRERLEESACIEHVAIASQHQSHDDATTKFLVTLHDGLNVESVLIPPRIAFRSGDAENDDEQRRLTLCISSQAGCPLDCKFCATATMGFLRNLTAGEIISQVLQIRKAAHRPITNIVFMGMGEPMMNYENVMTAVEILISGLNIAARRITISTAGWADHIRRMADDGCKAKLAVSLHSAVDETRAMLMPINKKYNLDQLAASIEYYHATTKKRVTYEYIFFDGINDTEHEVARLIKFARRVPCKVNIIPFHSIAFTGVQGIGSQLRPSPKMNAIADRLREANLSVFVRSNAGEDIAAACGQLVVKTERQRARQTRIFDRTAVGQ
ncbi:MAG: 23S rRNA (adenine(2503)-C(2))-methyltransferase RlmN [Ignavibacteriae bacterium]|nr:23S rRNA (adenine(2503)-C(2))-methyltransferase RlmN [Ignavibacteriota bacterium]